MSKSDDLVRRQGVIDALDKINCFGYIEASWDSVCDIVEGVPPADRWIPCSKKKPDTSDEVFVTYILNGIKNERYVGTARWWADDSDEGGYWTSISDEYRPLGTSIERIAWMPQPEPYKGGE